MKRRITRESLTGGTGDVNPQFLSFSATQSAADTTTTTQIALPIQRLPTGGSAYAQVMEVLKVFYMVSTLAEVDSFVLCSLTTKNQGTTTVAFSDPTVFSAYQHENKLTTSGTFFEVTPIVFDLTDGAGHGVIIATDNIFAQVASTTTSLVNTFRVKILYRFKNVSIQEYVGIVQGQQ